MNGRFPPYAGVNRIRFGGSCGRYPHLSALKRLPGDVARTLAAREAGCKAANRNRGYDARLMRLMAGDARKQPPNQEVPMKALSLAVLCAAALAGCHQPQPTPAPNVQAAANASDGGDFAAQLAALPEASRNGVFMRAIGDAGYDCQKVDSAKPHAPVEGRAAWAITCVHDVRYVAVADPKGYLQIVRGHFTSAAPAGNAS